MGYIGGDDYKEVALNDLNDMVLGHFNHPSIIIWGTRPNESPDDNEFMLKQTGSVKKWIHTAYH